MSSAPSRYAQVERAVLQWPDGRSTPYLRRRMIPAADPTEPLPTVAVGPDMRLDLVAARFLGDPLQAWRLGDANGLLDLAEASTLPGGRLRVPKSAF